MNDPALHHSWVGTGAWGEAYKRPERERGLSNPGSTCAVWPLARNWWGHVAVQWNIRTGITKEKKYF